MSDENIKVKVSNRKKLREMRSALGDDILRFIAELVTNSDDSYRRLESSSENFIGEKKIIICLDNDTRHKQLNEDDYMISVIDNAEGMDEETLKRIFSTYGEDNAGGIGKHARGIFGQGASDVLRAAAYEKRTAEILSIKNNEVTKLYYNVDENYDSSIKLDKLKLDFNSLKNIRDKYEIPCNGTVVSFGIPSTVKFTKKIKNELSNSIEKYPVFRYLLNQDDRKVYYKYNNEKNILSSVKYQFKENTKILDENFNFIYDGKTIECNLKLFKNENKKDDNTDIIIRDEYFSVFDNNMFGLTNDPRTKDLSGELLIKGLYKICYERLNSKTNPEAIVRDNRTGFESKSEFFQLLDKNITPKLQEVLNVYGRKTEVTNLENNKKFSDALKNLNKYLKSELKDEVYGGNVKGNTPPAEGIKFARNNASLTRGKEYNLKLYINSNLVSYNDIIKISYDDDFHIEVSPSEIQYKPGEINDGLVIKNITIKGLECTNESVKIQASVNQYIANILIDIIDMDIHYPENGIEFYPLNQVLTYNTPHILDLYIDTNVIPLKSRMELYAEGLEKADDVISFDESNLLSEDIALKKIKLEGGNVDNTYKVIVKYADIITENNITLIEPSNHDNQNGGAIAGFKLQENEDMDYQAYFNPKDHYIYINTKNPINLIMLGDMQDLDSENPKFKTEQIKYLCDIIANQSAAYLVKEKNVKNGEINFDDFEDAVEMVQNLIQTQKNVIYKKLYEALK